ncbi:hypothetical protein AAHA92_25228 [Salvia divinorum]|uniref:Uncharacterized protein n=1 Tax=Salvia divinorum TaxID=28513 RepID=A0ABD1GD33_SALDI
MGVLSKLKRQEKQDSQIKNVFLKIVRPGGQVELFRDSILAEEIMRRYPRYCITRPDFFDYPWIVVRPDSVLMPGEVFFLVPHYTVDKVMRDNMHRFQQSSDSPLHPPAEPTPHVRRAGALVGLLHNHKRSTTDHHSRSDHNDRSSNQQHQDRNHRRRTAYDHNHNNNITSDQDSDRGSLYKEMFYESWEEMRRRLEDSPLESRRPNHELVVAQRALPCLRKAGSGKRKVHLKVSFSSPIIIPDSQRGTPVH